MVSYSKAPHLHRRTPQVFPELSDAENYCRNPGGENERPWCYTKDPSVTWEYCNVSPCGDGRWLQFMISVTVLVLGPCKVLTYCPSHHGSHGPLINSVSRVTQHCLFAQVHSSSSVWRCNTYFKNGQMKTDKLSTLPEIIIRPKDEIRFPVVLWEIGWLQCAQKKTESL